MSDCKCPDLEALAKRLARWREDHKDDVLSVDAVISRCEAWSKSVQLEGTTAGETLGHAAVALAELIAQNDQLKAERDEADRRAGAAERRMERYRESEAARNDWLRAAKQAAGYSTSESFDTVFEEMLAKVNAVEQQQAGAEAMQLDAERWRFYAPQVARVVGVSIEEMCEDIDSVMSAGENLSP